MPQRAIAYLRVSVVGDREKRGRFESPDLQREAIGRWCSQHDVTIVREIYDRNRSGGNMTRPGIQEALEAVRGGEVQGIVVARSDRASRRALDGLQAIEDLAKAGGWIAAADGTIDTTTSAGRMATTMTFAMAESQLDSFRAQSKVIHERAIVERGRHMGPAPFGYTRDADNRLVPHPEHAEWLRHIFRRRADGIGWSEIARELKTADVHQEATGGLVTVQQLGRIVKRRVYLGEAHHGEWVHEKAHPALVDEALWHAANRARPTVTSAPWVGRAHPESLLRGLLRCSGCRYVLKRLPSELGKPPRWACRTLVGGCTHSCSRPARLAGREAATVEEYVIDEFMALVAGRRLDEAQPEDDVASLQEAAGDAEALLDELSSLDVRRDLGAARWSKMVAEAREAHEAATRRLASARLRVRPTGDSATLLAVWEVADTAGRQELLSDLLAAVMISAEGDTAVERTHVIPVWEAVDLPRRGVSDFQARPWNPGSPAATGKDSRSGPVEVR